MKKEDYEKYQNQKDVIVKTNDGQSYRLDFFQILADRLIGEYWETAVTRTLDNRYTPYKIRRTVRLKLSDIKSLEAWERKTKKVIPPSERIKILVLDFEGRGVSEQLIQESSQLLREKLEKSGVFNLDKHTEKDSKLQSYRERISRVKYASEVGKRAKVRTVVTGLIQKNKEDGIDIFAYVVDTREGKTEFSVGSKFLSASGLEEAITKIALKIARQQNESHAIQTFFQSALIPGLGQFTNGHRLRGLFFFGSTVACLVYHASIGGVDVDISNQPLLHTTQRSPFGPIQYWMDHELITAKRYYAELAKRKAALSAQDHKGLKTKVKIIGMCFYLANIFDALMISKKYDVSNIHTDRLSIKLYSDFERTGVTLVLNF